MKYMVGNRQNYTIGIFGVIVLAVVTAIVVQQKDGNTLARDSRLDSNTSDIVKVEKKNDLKSFNQSLELMIQCLKLPAQEFSNENLPIIESIVQLLQGPMGPVVGTSDRWLEWTLLTKDNKNKKYRLEITETDGGVVGRELHAFVGAVNTWTPEDIDDQIVNNPSDQVIEELLKTGEVISKSKAGVSLFPNGSRLEFIEVNGELEQVEIFDEDNQFGCKDIRSPETCICN